MTLAMERVSLHSRYTRLASPKLSPMRGCERATGTIASCPCPTLKSSALTSCRAQHREPAQHP